VNQRKGVTPAELSGVMHDNGKNCPAHTIRYHCRDPRGLLYGKARQIGRSWEIDPRAADDFAASWERYATLRK
jgi:hypothetical protein